MSERDHTALAPRKTAVGRADLLKLIHQLGLSRTTAIASLAGFEYVEPEDDDPPSPPPQQQHQPQPPAPSPNQPRPPLRATHFALVKRQHFSPLPTDSISAPEANTSTFASFDGSGDPAPSSIPLSPPRRLAVFLRRTLCAQQPGKQLDIPRLLEHLTRLSLPRYLPRTTHRRWGRESALVIDLSLPVFPLNDELITLAEQAHALSAGRLIVLCHHFSQGWLRRGSGRRAVWLNATEADLLAARHWLLAGDLGSLGADKANRRAWSRRLRTHLSAGGQATLLTGLADVDWKAQLPRQSRLVQWEHGQRLLAVRPERVPAALASESHADHVKKLLAAVALAVRIEPALLRELRLLLDLPIASELAVWNHADVDHCVLGMQIRPERLPEHRAHIPGLLLGYAQKIAQCIKRHHQELSRLIQLEEAALAADLANENIKDAKTQWNQALNTLKTNADGIPAKHLTAYLERTGYRAHPGLWQTVPALAEAYTLARKTQLRAGAPVPEGLPVSYLNRHLSEGADQDKLALSIIQNEGRLEIIRQPPLSAPFTLLACPPTTGFDLESATSVRRWWPASRAPEQLAKLAPGEGPWTVRASEIEGVIAEVPRPSWAIEWGRDRRGLYALAPSPLGTPVKLYWDDVSDSLESGDWPPGPRGFRAITQPLAQGLSLGADLLHGLYADARFGSVVQRFRWIEPGEFLMGSPESEPGRWDHEGPQHLVRLTEGFWLADTACTQALWQTVMGDNPSHFKDDEQNPVENMAFNAMEDFLRGVGKQLRGIEAKLPTEAEWEYASRAGTTTAYNFGDKITPKQANYDAKSTVPVKRFKPNAWGLYQMHGNVWEWCADDRRTYDASTQTNPEGAGAERVVRGGSWFSVPRWLRSAYRFPWHRGRRLDSQGFRFSLRSTSPEEGAERLPEAGAEVAPEARAHGVRPDVIFSGVDAHPDDPSAAKKSKRKK